MKQWIRDIFGHSRRKNFTGKLILNFNKGSVGSITVVREWTLTEKEVIEGKLSEIYGDTLTVSSDIANVKTE